MGKPYASSRFHFIHDTLFTRELLNSSSAGDPRQIPDPWEAARCGVSAPAPKAGPFEQARRDRNSRANRWSSFQPKGCPHRAPWSRGVGERSQRQRDDAWLHVAAPRMAAGISERKVGEIQSAARRSVRRCPDSAGLTMRVEPSGRAAYYVRYTARNGRMRCRIGARDSVTLRDARQEAPEIIAAVGAGRTRLPLPRIRERHVPPNVGAVQRAWRGAFGAHDSGLPAVLDQYVMDEIGDMPR